MPMSLRHVLRRPCTLCRLQRRWNSRLPRPASLRRPRLNYGSQTQLPEQEQSLNAYEVETGVEATISSHWARDPSSSTIRRSFSGIQPTGIPHLGNYLGALRQWKRLHDQATNPAFATDHHYEQYFSVVDLHALTSDVPGSERARLRKESFASLLAIGLKNSRKTTLFFQSDVPQHTSLMWILSTIASTGYLSRMTQWKSKLNLPDNANLDSDEATAKLKLGLFSYPVLQAADILLYQPSIVPVGADQLQHIEFARTLARGFNAHVKKKVFRIPWPVISPAKRIMSLKRPEHKMSKSDPDPKSRILITDSAEEIHAKLRGAITDSEAGISFDPERRPGVSNLVEILKHVTGSRESSNFIAKDNANVSMRAFKEMIASEIITALRGIRENFLEIMAVNDQLREEMDYGATKARRKARLTMADVQDALGLNPLNVSDEEANRMRARRRGLAERRVGTDMEIESNPWESEGMAEEAESTEDFLDEDGIENASKEDTLESIRRDTK